MTTTAGTGRATEAHGAAPPAPSDRGLRANVLGLPALFAQSIAVISPTMTAVLIIPLAFASAGQGTWLAYAFGTVMLLFVVFCLNQFARRSAFAGSMYAYTAKGLGPATGVFSGWTLIWAYYFIAVAGMCGFAVFCGQLLTALGYHGSVHPIFFFALSALGCWLVAYKDIRVSTILTMVLEGASVACILALAGVILFKHGFSVDTKQLSLSGVDVRGMGLAVVACIFSLVGFEAATTMGSEAKNPRRNLPRAVILSLLITGAFMVVMAYVEVAGTSNYGADWTAAPLNFLAQAYGVSFFKIPISIGAMVSFFSLSLSCLNAGSRIMFPMARHGIFTGHLGRAHATNRTPHVAVTVYIAMIFALPAVLMIFTNPLTAFGDAGTLAAFGFLVAYYLITIAAPLYLKKLGQLRPHQIALAVIAVLCLLVPTIGSFYPRPAWPVDLFPYIFLAYMLVGATWLVVAHRRQPGLLTEIEADLERAPEISEDEVVDVPEVAPQPVLA
jgi:amino acid transporter